jgi:hypothetical protein
MKKVYLFAPALLFGAVAFGQTYKSVPTAGAAESPYTSDLKIANSPIYQFGKAPGDVIYTNDFNGTLGGFTVEAGTQDTLWKFDLNGPNGQFSNATQKIQSTTNANGFAIFDADLSNPSSPYGDRIGKMTSPVVDMTSRTNAIISFQHTYRTCCANTFFPKLEVSTDNFGTFTTYDVTVAGTSVNVQPGTTVQKVNISDYLATAINLNNFQFRFFFDGVGGTTHYFWQIDDIVVYENFNNDLTIKTKDMYSGTLEIPYYNVPVRQITPITFMSAMKNDGAMTSNDAKLTVKISATDSVVSPTKTISSNTNDTLITAAYTPTSTLGMRNFSYTLSAAVADEQASDNLLLDSMNITTNIYSVDNGVTGGTITNFSTNANQPFKIGNVMEIIAKDTIDRMTITLSNAAANIGQLFSGEIQLYDAGTDTYNYLGEADEVTVTSGNNNSTITLTLIDPIIVNPGDQLLVLARHNGGPTDLGFRSAQRVETGIVLGYNAAQSLFALTNPRAVRVRLLFGPGSFSAGVAENTADIKVGNMFPNPTNDVSSLSYSLVTASDIKVIVTDLTGKVVNTQNISNQSAGGHSIDINASNFKSGIYYVNIQTNDSSVTKKLIKK